MTAKDAPPAPSPETNVAKAQVRWQERWDEEWARIQQERQSLASERKRLETRERQTRTRVELERCDLAEQRRQLCQERTTWLTERKRLQTELETLHAQAFIAWEDLRADCQAWEAQRQERLEVGEALLAELRALDRRVVHQRAALARVQLQAAKHVECGTDLQPGASTNPTVPGQEPDLVGLVAQAWQEAVDLMSVLAERQELLDALQARWLVETERAGQHLAERDEAVERRERHLAGRERWIDQRERAIDDARTALAQSWQKLVAEQARFARERERQDAQRQRLLLTVKTRVRSAEAARQEAVLAKAAWMQHQSTTKDVSSLERRQDDLLAMNAALGEERHALASERRRLRSKNKALQSDRALLRRRVDLLNDQLERLALALVQGEDSPVLAMSLAA